MRPPNRRRWIDVSLRDGDDGREDCQAGWQTWCANRFSNVSILDVGAGLGLSRARLSKNGNQVTLQDVAPNMPVDISDDVHCLKSKWYDVVTAFDVIEHVDKDEEFLQTLCRIARQFVVFTTPNRTRTKCKNVFHRREYTPEELVYLLKPYQVECYLSAEPPYEAIQVLNEAEFLKHNARGQGAVLKLAIAT